MDIDILLRTYAPVHQPLTARKVRTNRVRKGVQRNGPAQAQAVAVPVEAAEYLQEFVQHLWAASSPSIHNARTPSKRSSLAPACQLRRHPIGTSFCAQSRKAAFAA